MQKKRWLGIFVLALLLIVVSVQFVEMVSADPVTEWIGSKLGSWEEGKGFGDGFARVLFGIVIAVLVYSVADRLPGLNKKELSWARWVIAGVVAYFGTAYLIRGELLALIAGYSALGFTLAFIVPFLVLIFFSYDIAMSSGIVNLWVKKLLIRTIWFLFLVFALYRLVIIRTASTLIPDWLVIGLWLAVAGALFVMIFTGWMIKKLWKGKKEMTLAEMHNNTDLIKAYEESQKERAQSLGSQSST